jgi:hypothetical protein
MGCAAREVRGMRRFILALALAATTLVMLAATTAAGTIPPCC